MEAFRVLVLCFALLELGGTLQIDNCETNWIEIREDNIPTTPITCKGFANSSTVVWTLSSNGQEQGPYTCDPGVQQCVQDGDITVTVDRSSQDTSSTLTVIDNHRSTAGNGTVVCKVEGNQASCRTNVINPAKVSLCDLHLDETNWTVTGSCQYEEAYSSNGTYTCTWYRSPQGQSSRDYLSTVNLEKTQQEMSSQVNYSGTCSLPPSPLPVQDGPYSYIVDFLPGPLNKIVDTITIQSPGDSGTLWTTCPQYVCEGRPVQCSCRFRSGISISPSPVAQWSQSSSGSLVTQPVHRTSTGHNYSCELIWGLPASQPYKTINYTLDVAYGPDEVTITEVQDVQPSDNSTVTLRCTATSVHPSATFSWDGVTCLGSDSDSSSIDSTECSFSTAGMKDGHLVNCTAGNSALPDCGHQNATYTPLLKGDDGGAPLLIILVAVLVPVAIIVIVIIIVIIVVINRKKRHRPVDSAGESTKEKNTSENQGNGQDATEDEYNIASFSKRPRQKKTDNTADPIYSHIAHF